MVTEDRHRSGNSTNAQENRILTNVDSIAKIKPKSTRVHDDGERAKFRKEGAQEDVVAIKVNKGGALKTLKMRICRQSQENKDSKT